VPEMPPELAKLFADGTSSQTASQPPASPPPKQPVRT